MKIKSALISVFHKDGLEPIVAQLKALGVTIYSTGGTQKFIEEQGAEVIPVESLTDYPSIFGGRVKTLHPKVFGGILHRRDHSGDIIEADKYEIPGIDLVIVDLYPFQETVAQTQDETAIIEKIDIGGIALIRAAAKNFKDVLIVASRDRYTDLLSILESQNGETELSQRRDFASHAFSISSDYDTAIFNYFNSTVEEPKQLFKQSIHESKSLRYGENPHQQAVFYGNLNEMFEQLNGKELSYNNLVDIDAAAGLIAEFDASETAFAILKHTNACGMALGSDVKDAYLKALASDTISAFGGVLICNRVIDLAAAEEIHKLFFEVLAAPGFNDDALELLSTKKKRVLLKQKPVETSTVQFKTLLNGVIEQDKDLSIQSSGDLQTVTKAQPTEEMVQALLFANKIVKHTKSNTIVLAAHGQLFASGVGQTSRVDALKQAILKAKSFGFDLNNAVMASDAFFPFPDCVEIAHGEGIKAVVQPGGSIKDKDSIAFCDEHDMAMVFTGVRHFKH